MSSCSDSWRRGDTMPEAVCLRYSPLLTGCPGRDLTRLPHAPVQACTALRASGSILHLASSWQLSRSETSTPSRARTLAHACTHAAPPHVCESSVAQHDPEVHGGPCRLT